MARAKKNSEKKDVPEGISDADETPSKPEDVAEESPTVEETQTETPDSENVVSSTDEIGLEHDNNAPLHEGNGKSHFLPLVFGGVCAAAIGFGASQYMGNEFWPFAKDSSVEDELVKAVDAQKSEIESLSAQTEGLLAAKTADARENEDRSKTITAAIAASDAGINSLNTRFDDLAARLTDIENRPIPDVGATANAVAAYERELAAMREMFAGELSKIETAQTQAVQIQESAAVNAEKAMVDAALAKLEAAVNAGGPFGPALETIKAAGANIPAILDQTSESGVPTELQLQQDFPAFARSAQTASLKSAAESGETGKFTAFLQRQLGTRSLEPRDGEDADAILSRAEDALRHSDISKSLVELEALPESGKVEMAIWITAAQTRRDALAAVSALAEVINE